MKPYKIVLVPREIFVPKLFLEAHSKTGGGYKHMNNGIERRRHPRIPIDWPVVLITSQGAIHGKTANISEGGSALILFSGTPEVGDEIAIIFKSPEDHEMYVPCEKIWSGSVVVNESVYSAIGVHFIEISSSDRKIIASMVGEYISFKF